MEPGDEDIAAAVAAGRPRAFETLYDRYAQLVFRACSRRVAGRQDAEDAMSATFLQAWRIHQRAVTVEGSLRPWLLAIALNVVRNQQRSEQRRAAAWHRQAAEPLDIISPDPANAVLEMISFSQDAGILAAGIEDLPEGERLVVELCLLEGLTAVQAAVALRIPGGTVRSRLCRARSRLRLLLQESDHDESGEHVTTNGHHQGGRHLAVPAVNGHLGRPR